MRRFAWVLAIAATFVFASAAMAQTPAKRHVRHRHAAAQTRHMHRIRHFARTGYGHVHYLPAGASGRGTGYRELVGDPGSGVGFYPLPYPYRVGAWRQHMREASVPPFIRNGVLYAMTMDAYRYNYAGATPVNSYRYGVFDPFDGVGTPYFAGFYGPGDDDDDGSGFPFGRPYSHN